VHPYVLITPNETRRNQLQQVSFCTCSVAKKELNGLEQWKKEHRPGPVDSTSYGKESEAQARQKQQMMPIQSKYQQKHKREEYVKVKKAAEEAEILKKKAIQREKLTWLLKSWSHIIKVIKTNELLNRLDLGFPKSDSCQTANRGQESTAW
ncbi:ESIP1 protein, partial [Centropus bengalensis]|nr:ESIP1 protein [Centropus bengalensis]